jgi:hypothetical protein
MAPYPADRARGELLKYKGVQARWPEPAQTVIHSGDFVACATIHRWFVTYRR